MSGTGRAAQRVEPFHFGSPAQPLYGCWHPPVGAASGRAFVLCQPLGHEFLQFHRLHRQLAIMLADAGHGVLRFDARGCGDSAGAGESWRLSAWTEDTLAAVEECKRRAGSAEVGLVGMRLGGALALAAAAARDDVDALVLWDPVIDGRAYLDELRALHQSMVDYAHVVPDPADSRQEILGFPLPDAFIEDLQAIDHSALARRPAQRALLIQSHETVGQDLLRKALLGVGVRVEHERLPNPHLWVWIEDFGKVHVPHKILQAITAWAGKDS
ncbi:MAG: alpha/beta fold hydrolase [Planctomycetota bacterium]